MKTHAHDHYTYRVTWSEEDNEHVGLCAEFPSLSWLDASPDATFDGIRRLVAGVLLEMKRSGERPPQPLSTRAFSGKFIVRIPPDVHRKLAIEAAEAGVSLNRVASARLA
jgi:hypothetical protein